MDFFGISAALKGSFRIYCQSSRATGRTTSLVESVKTGDRIIFTNGGEAKRFERLVKERDETINIHTKVVDPRQPDKVYESGSSQGRTIFDHTWVEQFYEEALNKSIEDLRYLQDQTSGYGEPHRNTRRKALEIAKWNY